MVMVYELENQQATIKRSNLSNATDDYMVAVICLTILEEAF